MEIKNSDLMRVERFRYYNRRLLESGAVTAAEYSRLESAVSAAYTSGTAGTGAVSSAVGTAVTITRRGGNIEKTFDKLRAAVI